MSTITSKSDTEIKNDVLSELKYEPRVKVTDIGVLVKDGTVTLNGFATSYGEKWDAVKAVKRIAGVKAIADDIEVKFPDTLRRDDGDIATAAANLIAWSTTIPKEGVQVTVSQGRITLEGQVEWWYQKAAAEDGVRYLTGVNGVSNRITIKPRVTPTKIEEAIQAAFERRAVLDAKKIEVETSSGKVTLTGTVRNYAEWDEAEQVAWAAPGVSSVHNELTVDSAWY